MPRLPLIGEYFIFSLDARTTCQSILDDPDVASGCEAIEAKGKMYIGCCLTVRCPPQFRAILNDLSVPVLCISCRDSVSHSDKSSVHRTTRPPLKFHHTRNDFTHRACISSSGTSCFENVSCTSLVRLLSLHSRKAGRAHLVRWPKFQNPWKICSHASAASSHHLGTRPLRPQLVGAIGIRGQEQRPRSHFACNAASICRRTA